jgi:hypothetical protein
MIDNYPVPTVTQVSRELVAIQRLLERCEPGDQHTDVRLQVTESGWQVHYGDLSYDDDHSGHWGAATLSVGDDLKDRRAIALDLIDQVLDSIQCDDVGDRGDWEK